MKINYVKINGFGKLKNKFMKLEDGINIVYGENETGKSTIVKFLSAIFYGISKNKNGKAISDFEQYSPWDNGEFSGKINYEINNEEFEVFREFSKKNPKIYNAKGEDITKIFSVNKAKEVDFFTEQCNVDENTFLNTAVLEQECIELNEKSTNSIVQRLSNLVSTGDDNISFQKSMRKIEAEQTDNIGTDKTKNRPINIVNSEISELNEEKKSIESSRSKFENDLADRVKKLEELVLCQNQKACVKGVKKCQDDLKIMNAEVEFCRKIENEYLQKSEQLKNQIDKSKNEKQEKKVKPKVWQNVINVLAIIWIVLITVFFAQKLIVIIPMAVLIANLVYYKTTSSKYKKIQNEETEKLKIEYGKIQNEYEEKKNERSTKENNFLNQKNIMVEETIKLNASKVDESFLRRLFEMNETQLEKYADEIENRCKNLSVQLQLLQNEIDDIDLKLEKLVMVEEELEKKQSEKLELISLNTSYNIAKECLEAAYEEIKNNLSPKFENKLCEVSNKITDGKYSKIILNEENGLFVEVANGNYMPISRLSVGTIDELYLALRLSILDEISYKEKMPIIFDETFAYFDNNRLENSLKYLLENNYENQIIIFTCSRREEEILNKLKVDYNLVKLEKF